MSFCRGRVTTMDHLNSVLWHQAVSAQQAVHRCRIDLPDTKDLCERLNPEVIKLQWLIRQMHLLSSCLLNLNNKWWQATAWGLWSESKAAPPLPNCKFPPRSQPSEFDCAACDPVELPLSALITDQRLLSELINFRTFSWEFWMTARLAVSRWRQPMNSKKKN